MHISLTPELEAGIRQKVASGYYNNASEVIRDALRFWESNEELVQYMKLGERSRQKNICSKIFKFLFLFFKTLR